MTARFRRIRLIDELSELSVPLSVKVCVPAIWVMVTSCPLTVMLTGAEPLLHAPVREVDEVTE